eukprot:Rmarinus@m.12560
MSSKSKVVVRLLPKTQRVKQAIEDKGLSPFLELVVRPHSQIAKLQKHLRSKWSHLLPSDVSIRFQVSGSKNPSSLSVSCTLSTLFQGPEPLLLLYEWDVPSTPPMSSSYTTTPSLSSRPLPAPRTSTEPFPQHTMGSKPHVDSLSSRLSHLPQSSNTKYTGATHSTVRSHTPAVNPGILSSHSIPSQAPSPSWVGATTVPAPSTHARPGVSVRGHGTSTLATSATSAMVPGTSALNQVQHIPGPTVTSSAVHVSSYASPQLGAPNVPAVDRTLCPVTHTSVQRAPTYATSPGQLLSYPVHSGAKPIPESTPLPLATTNTRTPYSSNPNTPYSTSSIANLAQANSSTAPKPVSGGSNKLTNAHDVAAFPPKPTSATAAEPSGSRGTKRGKRKSTRKGTRGETATRKDSPPPRDPLPASFPPPSFVSFGAEDSRESIRALPGLADMTPKTPSQPGSGMPSPVRLAKDFSSLRHSSSPATQPAWGSSTPPTIPSHPIPISQLPESQAPKAHVPNSPQRKLPPKMPSSSASSAPGPSCNVFSAGNSRSANSFSQKPGRDEPSESRATKDVTMAESTARAASGGAAVSGGEIAVSGGRTDVAGEDLEYAEVLMGLANSRSMPSALLGKESSMRSDVVFLSSLNDPSLAELSGTPSFGALFMPPYIPAGGTPEDGRTSHSHNSANSHCGYGYADPGGSRLFSQGDSGSRLLTQGDSAAMYIPSPSSRPSAPAQSPPPATLPPALPPALHVSTSATAPSHAAVAATDRPGDRSAIAASASDAPGSSSVPGPGSGSMELRGGRTDSLVCTERSISPSSTSSQQPKRAFAHISSESDDSCESRKRTCLPATAGPRTTPSPTSAPRHPQAGAVAAGATTAAPPHGSTAAPRPKEYTTPADPQTTCATARNVANAPLVPTSHASEHYHSPGLLGGDGPGLLGGGDPISPMKAFRENSNSGDSLFRSSISSDKSLDTFSFRLFGKA